MNTIADLVLPQAVFARVSAAGKRQAIQAIAEALVQPFGLDARAVVEAVMQRERLAGTGVGEGVAIPHARVTGLSQPIGGFARLEAPVDFDALDGRGADLVFLLLAPAERGGEHLKALARVSRVLRRGEVRDRLRAARGQDELLAVFTDGVDSHAA